MSYTVVIPSYKRSHTLTKKTLHLLTSRGVRPEDIHIWVADSEEEEFYSAVVPRELYGEIRVSAPTLCASRNVIARSYPVGTNLVWVDDDLENLIVRLNDKETEPLADVDKFIEEAFSLTKSAGLNLWGVYPVKNPYFMKQRVRTDLTYIEGAFYGTTVRNDPCELVTLEDKEDFERSMLFYLRDGGVVRFEYVAMVTKFYKEPGGMQETRTEERVTRSAETLARRYPYLCKTRVSKKGHTELSLRDRRKN